MGYCTYYVLSLYGDDEATERCVEDFIREGTAMGFTPDQMEDFVNEDVLETKSREVEELCKKVARMNPDVLIRLEGDGEESDDLWESRFKGNLYERQDFTMPPFTTPELQIPD